MTSMAQCLRMPTGDSDVSDDQRSVTIFPPYEPADPCLQSKSSSVSLLVLVMDSS